MKIELKTKVGTARVIKNISNITATGKYLILYRKLIESSLIFERRNIEYINILEL